jgi:hypothetical protein
MSRKQRFPPEPETRPDTRPSKDMAPRPSGPAPKSRRERAEAPTLPPPRPGSERRATEPPVQAQTQDEARDATRSSGVRARRSPLPSVPAATVDEVVADLTKDPRRERDDDE